MLIGRRGMFACFIFWGLGGWGGEGGRVGRRGEGEGER